MAAGGHPCPSVPVPAHRYPPVRFGAYGWPPAGGGERSSPPTRSAPRSRTSACGTSSRARDRSPQPSGGSRSPGIQAVRRSRSRAKLQLLPRRRQALHGDGVVPGILLPADEATAEANSCYPGGATAGEWVEDRRAIRRRGPGSPATALRASSPHRPANRLRKDTEHLLSRLLHPNSESPARVVAPAPAPGLDAGTYPEAHWLTAG